MNRFYALGLLSLVLTLLSCYHISAEKVPVFWIYPWSHNARKMVRAVMEEDIERIDELVQSGKVDVNMKARGDTGFLYIATLLEKKQSYVKLLDLGADMHRGYYNAPVYYAAGYFAEVAGDLYYLEEALKRGLDPSARLDFLGYPIFFPLKAPMSGYAQKGILSENYLAKLKLLISYGADLSLPSKGPSEVYPFGWGGNVIVDAAMSGHYNAVYYLLSEFEDIQYKDYKHLNAETNEYEYTALTVLTEVEKIANADSWWIPLGRVQEFTYPWFLKTVEWLEARGEVLDIPDDLSRILTIGRDEMDYITHYKIDKHGNITPME